MISSHRRQSSETVAASRQTGTVFPQAIFFDLDGTLVDGNATWRAAVNETVRLICADYPGIDHSVLEAVYYEAADAAWELVKIPSAPAWGSMEAESVVADVWTKALQRAGVLRKGAVDQAVAHYYANLQTLGAPIYDDVTECLCRLNGRHRLGIITNGSAAVQQSKIDHAGLAHCFESVTTSDVGVGKPDRRIFELAAKTMEVRLSESVYVGDRLDWDIGGANGAGMVSVWLNRKQMPRKCSDPVPSVMIVKLVELPAAICRMKTQDPRKP